MAFAAALGFAMLWLWAPAGLSGAVGQGFDFFAIGDVPYINYGIAGNAADMEERFANLIAAINAARPVFTVHVGDIKGGGSPCTDANLARVLGFFSQFEDALVYTPGDNEWTDCHRRSNGGHDPLKRLERVREIFFAAPRRSLGARPIPLAAQSDEKVHSAYVENARWERGGVVFVTLHAVGSNNNLDSRPGAKEEFTARDAANAAWLRLAFAQARKTSARGVVLFMQADPFLPALTLMGSGFNGLLAAFVEETSAFARPVLLIHGDGHEYLVDQPLRREGATVTNFTRVQVFGDQEVHAVRVRVGAAGEPVFSVAPFRILANPTRFRDWPR
jgi:hypothetical protein